MVLDYKTHKRDKYQYEVVSPVLRSHHLHQGRIGPDTVTGDTWLLTGDHRSGWSQHDGGRSAHPDLDLVNPDFSFNFGGS